MRVFSHYVFVLSSIVLGIILVFDLLSNPVYDLGQHNIYIPQNNYIVVPEYYYDVFCVTREVPVEKQITSNKSGDSPVVLADWTSTEELEDFLAADDTDSRLVLTADSNGTVEFDGICEDRALQLRDRAMLQGKFLSVEILHRDEYYKWYGKWIPQGQYHAVCLARIDEEFYIVDPETDKYWLAYVDN